MEQSIQVVIKDLELKSIKYEKTLEEFKEKFEVELKSKMVEMKKDNDEIQYFVEFQGVFSAKFDNSLINAIYNLAITFPNINDKNAIEKFLYQEKYSLAYPMLSKMSSLICKLSEENRPFPLILSPDDWQFNDSNISDELGG